LLFGRAYGRYCHFMGKRFSASVFKLMIVSVH
jgi:hypothetical protein